jgi:hypothetical protein
MSNEPSGRAALASTDSEGKRDDDISHSVWYVVP